MPRMKKKAGRRRVVRRRSLEGLYRGWVQPLEPVKPMMRISVDPQHPSQRVILVQVTT